MTTLNDRPNIQIQQFEKEKKMPRAEIKDIYRDNSQRIVSGVKGGHGYQRTPYGYYNGAGAFCFYPEPGLTMEAWVFCLRKKVYVDIREDILNVSGRQRLSSKYINELRADNVGNVVNLYWDGEEYRLSDVDDLTY